MKLVIFTFTPRDDLALEFKPFYAPVCSRLELALYQHDFHQAIQKIKCTAWVASSPGGLSKEEERAFKVLPRYTVSARKGLIQVHNLSQITFDEARGQPVIDLYNQTRGEVASWFKALQASPKTPKDFKWEKFHKVVGQALSRPFLSEEEVLWDSEQLEQLESLGGASVNPWSNTDIVLDRYHENAKRLLAEPILWDLGSPFSPHGSDLGNLVLEDFFGASGGSTRLNSKNFLAQSLAEIGFKKSYSGKVDEETAREEFAADPTLYLRSCQIVLAVVFADIKLKGKTTKELAKLGLAACRRRSFGFVESMSYQPLWEDNVDACEKMTEALRQFA